MARYQLKWNLAGRPFQRKMVFKNPRTLDSMRKKSFVAGYPDQGIPEYPNSVPFCHMDNCGNSRANTCAQTRLRRRVVFVEYRTNPSGRRSRFGATENGPTQGDQNLSARRELGRLSRCELQILRAREAGKGRNGMNPSRPTWFPLRGGSFSHPCFGLPNAWGP